MKPNNKNGLSNTQPKSVAILEKIRKSGAFEITPEVESFIKTAADSGFDEAHIIQGINAKRKLATNDIRTVDPNNLTQEVVVDDTAPKVDPFKGKTRTQFLKEAFLSGVTSFTELEKLGKTYDMLATPEDGLSTEGVDFTNQEALKASIEEQAVEKMQALPDATARDSALSALTTFRTGKDIIDTLESGKVKTGFFEGTSRQIPIFGARSRGATSKEEDNFAALTETFAANFRKALSGTAVADKEMVRLDRFLPSETKTRQQNIEGVKALSKYLSDKTSLQLGYDVSPLIPQEQGSDPLNVFGAKTNNSKNPLAL